MKKAIFNNGVTDYRIVTAAEPSSTERGIVWNMSDIFKSLGE